MTDDLMTYDGDLEHLDEIVVADALVHIERLNTHEWMIRITRSDEVEVHLKGYDLTVQEAVCGFERVDEPLVGLCHEWTTDDGRHHQCFEKHRARSGFIFYHQCQCRARKQVR